MIFAPTRLYATALYIFCLCLAANLLQAQTYHFKKIHCKLSADDSIGLNEMALFEAKFYNTVFNTAINDTLPIYVNLYGRKAEFNAVQHDTINKEPVFVGYYSPDENQIFMIKSDDYETTLVHETSHDLLYHNYSEAPKWLDEGIAQLFESVGSKDGTYFLSPWPDKVNFVKTMYYQHTFNLAAFFKYKDDDWYIEKNVEYLYATSYCIVYYLAAYDLESLSNILTLMKHGYSTTDAIAKVFGTFDKFEKRFNDFYRPGVDYSPQ